MQGNYHNGSAFVWLTDSIILTYGLTTEGERATHFIDVTTGEDVVAPIVGAPPPDSVHPGLKLVPIAVHGDINQQSPGATRRLPV